MPPPLQRGARGTLARRRCGSDARDSRAGVTEARPCPVCGRDVDRERDRRWRKDGFDIVRCRSCGLLFRFDLPAREELDEIYGGAYFDAAEGTTHGQGYHDYLGDEAVHRLNARRRLSVLEALSESKGALLDVGAAAGFFVDEARLAGWEAVGVDIADPMVRFARERLNVEVTRTTLAEAGIEDESFDVVTLWDYIEHSTDPLDELLRVARALRPGGVIGLSTGDAASTVARLSGSRWHLLTPRHHCFFFTRSTLRVALEKAGFEIESMRRAGAVYPVSYLIYKLRTLAPLPLLGASAERLRGTRLGRVSVPVNLGDIVTVWARRR